MTFKSLIIQGAAISLAYNCWCHLFPEIMTGLSKEVAGLFSDQMVQGSWSALKDSTNYLWPFGPCCGLILLTKIHFNNSNTTISKAKCICSHSLKTGGKRSKFPQWCSGQRQHTGQYINEAVQTPQVAIFSIALYPGSAVVQGALRWQGSSLSKVNHPDSCSACPVVYKK